MAASSPMRSPWTSGSRAGTVLAAALVALHAGLALHQAGIQSATYDEPYYATAGWARLAGGKGGLNPEHPPAVKLWLGASWLGAGLPPPAGVPGFEAADQWTFGPRALYRDPARAPACPLNGFRVGLGLGLGMPLPGRAHRARRVTGTGSPVTACPGPAWDRAPGFVVPARPGPAGRDRAVTVPA